MDQKVKDRFHRITFWNQLESIDHCFVVVAVVAVVALVVVVVVIVMAVVAVVVVAVVAVVVGVFAEHSNNSSIHHSKRKID